MKYEIEIEDYYILIRGEVEIGDLCSFQEMASKRGFNIADVSAGQALGGLVFTNEKGSAELRSEIDKRNKNLAPEEQWIQGWDRGVSSETIFYVMTTVAGKPWRFRADVPHDPSDFGRCFRLLEKFPAWRERLSEVAARYPKWAGLVENWAELEKIYKRDTEKYESPELYKKLQELTHKNGN